MVMETGVSSGVEPIIEQTTHTYFALNLLLCFRYASHTKALHNFSSYMEVQYKHTE